MDKSRLDAENWEKIAQDYIRYIKNERDGYLKFLIYGSLFSSILTLVDGVKGKLILDAGCGEGRLARVLAEHGAAVSGCDVSPTMIQEAGRIESKSHYGISYFIHDLVKPLNNGVKYDIAVVNLVLFNIFDFEKVITNLAKTLKPDGRLIISLLHPCFNITKSQWYNLRFIGYRGGEITFGIKKSYKERNVYKKDYLFKENVVNYYHRPIESYVRELGRNRLLVDSLLEPVLELSQVYDKDTYHHHYLPRFLLIRSVKQ